MTEHARPKRPQHPRTPWPSTLGIARRLIAETFAKNNWDERSVRFYLNTRGIRPVAIDELSYADCQTILERMRQTRMIIFQEDADQPDAPPPVAMRRAA